MKMILILCALLAAACTSTPIEPYLYAPPHLGAATDGNVTVLVAKIEGRAGVRLLPATDDSLHLLGPVETEAGRIVVMRRRPVKERLVLRPGDPLPEWSRHLWSPSEAAALGLTFADDGGPGAPPELQRITLQHGDRSYEAWAWLHPDDAARLGGRRVDVARGATGRRRAVAPL